MENPNTMAQNNGDFLKIRALKIDIVKNHRNCTRTKFNPSF